MTDPEETEELSPAQRSLERHLELLRAAPPAPSPTMVPHIIRSARWQRTIRQPLAAFGSLAGALRDGILLLVGAGRRP